MSSSVGLQTGVCRSENKKDIQFSMENTDLDDDDDEGDDTQSSMENTDLDDDDDEGDTQSTMENTDLDDDDEEDTQCTMENTDLDEDDEEDTQYTMDKDKDLDDDDEEDTQCTMDKDKDQDLLNKSLLVGTGHRLYPEHNSDDTIPLLNDDYGRPSEPCSWVHAMGWIIGTFLILVGIAILLYPIEYGGQR